MHDVRMLRTDWLLLRSWRPEDRQALARMNADPEVMEFFVAPLTREESDAFVDRIEAGFAEHGFGVWAVEAISTGAFIGFTGLLPQAFEAAFTPASRSATGLLGMPGARATPPRPPGRR
jgi:RimJ/RimL family protein N-acetyltransferase